MAIEPDPLVTVIPLPAVMAAAVYVVPFPIGIWPLVGTVVIPRPPLAGTNTPARVTAPVVEDAGVSPVVPVLNEVTPPLAIVMLPAAGVIVMPVPAVSEATTGAAPVEPIRISPFVSMALSTIPPPDETMMRLLFNVVDELVPPLAIGKTPVTPVVRLIAGISAATRLLNVGVETPPDTGPANTVFAVCVAKDTARVPVDVIGDPDTLRKPGTDIATDVTVPPVPVALMVMLPAALTIETPEPAVSVAAV